MSKKLKYQVCNWKEYNQSLINRGSISLWFGENITKQWYADISSDSCFQQKYSDMCIQCGLRIKAMYGLSLRAVQGFLKSLVEMLELDLVIPNYSTFCRRQKKILPLLEQPNQSQENMVILIDSTGLKVFGEGEWKTRMHGYNYRRVWRKMHIAIDAETQQIEAVVLSTNDFKDGEILDDLLDQIEVEINKVVADGAYESFGNFESVEAINAEAIIPPRKDAKIKQHGNTKKKPLPRDEVVRAVKKSGLKKWKKDAGYHIRSLVETAMFRFKSQFGDQLSARSFESQLVEVIEKCSILNILTSLGMPDGKMA